MIAVVSILFTILLALFIFNEGGSTGYVLFSICLIALIIASMLLGSQTQRECKYKKTPTIKVECLGNKCDTTYIYKF